MIIDLSFGHVCGLDLEGGLTNPGAEYGPPQGFDLLRKMTATWLGVAVDTVAITTGASLGLSAVLSSLERPCSVLCPRPYYPNYPRIAKLLGLDLIYYDLRQDAQWQPDPEEIVRLVRGDTRAILWNCPGNPVGSLLTTEMLVVLKDIAERRNLLVISDEVYADFIYDGAQLPDLSKTLGLRSVVRIRSFSKLLGIPGERVGFIVAAPEHLTAICRAHWTLALSPPTTAQAMALTKMRQGLDDRLRKQCNILQSNRDRMVEILTNCARVNVTKPRAGIFLWVGVPNCPVDSAALAEACKSQARVAVMPGAAFGITKPVYLRVSFGVAKYDATRGAQALADFLESSFSRSDKVKVE